MSKFERTVSFVTRNKYKILAVCILIVVIVILFYFLAPPKTPNSSPTVEISDGKILGSVGTTPEGRSFFKFQGIPFAAPPIGNLRLADPQPPKKWTELKDCSNRNIVCIQTREYISEYETEDCLVLNVYTPKIPSNKNESDLAVLVYFYGGGFYIGNSTLDAYGPDFFMEYGVVIVTVNYRLGPFGFLSTGDAVIPGNFGLKDQQFALKWVKNNIVSFGGDPNLITLFGNSAGSASIGYQILNENSKGLFRAAIMTSGTPLSAWSFQRNPKRIAYLTIQHAHNSTISKSEDILYILRNISADDLRQASLKVFKTDYDGFDQILNGYYYAPVLDTYNTENGFLKDHTYESLKKGNFSHVPLMIGITSEEILSLVEELDYLKIILKKYDLNPELLVNVNFNITNNEIRKIVGNLIYKIYVKNGSTFENSLEKGITFYSDLCMNNGVIKHAYLESKYTNVFLYKFSYDGVMGNYSKSMNGTGKVTHTEDMNYIWRRNIPTANNMNLGIFPEEDKITQKRLLTLYTNFAKYLSPTPKNDSLLQNIKWPMIDLNKSKDAPYLDINCNLDVKNNLKQDTYKKWNDLYIQYAIEPIDNF